MSLPKLLNRRKIEELEKLESSNVMKKESTSMNRIYMPMFLMFVVLIVTSCVQLDDLNSETNRSKTILVTGATGTQGGAVARELLNRGYTVRGLTRNLDSDRAKVLRDLGVKMVQGDFANTTSLLNALEGVYGVFVVTVANSADQEIMQGRNFIEAAKISDIKHFVYTSASNADENTGVPHFDSKYEVEKSLYESGLKYSVVRPVEFMDNFRNYWIEQIKTSGTWLDPREPTKRHQWISAKDIGFIVGEVFDNPEEWVGKAVNIAGDEITIADFVEAISNALEMKVNFKKVSWQEYEELVGEDMAKMYRFFDDSGYSADLDSLRYRYPNLSTWNDYLKDPE